MGGRAASESGCPAQTRHNCELNSRAQLAHTHNVCSAFIIGTWSLAVTFHLLNLWTLRHARIRKCTANPAPFHQWEPMLKVLRKEPRLAHLRYVEHYNGMW